MTAPRIVIIANNIDEVGGAQRVVHVVGEGLARRGYEVELVGVAPVEPRHEFIADPSYVRHVLMSAPWPAPSPQHEAARARLRAEAVDRLGAVLGTGRPGVIVTAQLWAMEHVAEVPHDEWAVIGQYHSSYAAARQGRDWARAMELYRDVDAFTLLTPEDARRFRQDGLNNTSWLPNPLALWPEAPVAGSARQVTYVGRLSSEKGVRFLLDAWAHVAKAWPDWSLRLVGSGPDEKALRKQAAALESAHGDLRIAFEAPVTDVLGVYADAGIVVLPSLTEGLPLVLAEAMACGLPCIAANCSPGVALLAEDGAAARLAPRGNATALADAIASLMADPQGRSELGQRARRAMEPYRLDAVLDRWERLLAAVLR